MRGSSTRPAWLWLAAICAAGLLLRLIGIGSQSLWLDEMTSITVARQPLSAILSGEVFDNHTPPLYYVLLHGWGALFGWSEAAVRGMSATFDLANLVLVALLARRWLGGRAAVLVTLAYAVSPFAIYYAQEARMYTMIVTFGLLFAWSLERILRGQRPWAWAVLAAGSLAAGVYTHYFFAFYAFGPMLLALWHGRRAARSLAALLAAGTAAVLAFLPWIPRVLTLIESGGQGFREHGLATLPYALFRFLAGYALMPLNMDAKADMWGTAAAHAPLIGLAFLLFAGAAFAGWRAARGDRARWLACWWLAGCPAAIGLAVTLVVPSLSERYLIVGYPFLLAALLGWQPRSARLGRAVSGFLLVFLAVGTIALHANPAYGKTDWRRAAAHVQDRVPADGAVLVQPSFAADVFRYYYRGEAPVIPLDLRWIAQGLGEEAIDRVFAHYDEVILVGRGRHADVGFNHLLRKKARPSEPVIFDKETGVVCTVWRKNEPSP